MYLVFVEVEFGDGLVVVDEEADVIVCCFDSSIVPEFSSMALEAWWS